MAIGDLMDVSCWQGRGKLTKQRHNSERLASLAAAFAAIGLAGGCGDVFVSTAGVQTLFVSECDGSANRTVADVALLDWSGGVTPLYPNRHFAQLDLSMFNTKDGGKLSDDGALFKRSVVDQVNRIFCESGGPTLRVRDADFTQDVAGTTVVLTQSLSPAGELQIGEGEYDVCNAQHNNVAVIFGERIRLLGANYRFDEWVMVFANVAAHEIGHTLGYGHVSREQHAPDERSLYVELMLDGHTMSELRREQRIITLQSTCPPQRGFSKRLVDEYPTIACDGVDHPEN